MVDYERFSRSFTPVRAEDVPNALEAACRGGHFWLAALSPDTFRQVYPSEIFRVLKSNQNRRFGEYRTARLVLEAWDRLAGVRVAI